PLSLLPRRVNGCGAATLLGPRGWRSVSARSGRRSWQALRSLSLDRPCPMDFPDQLRDDRPRFLIHRSRRRKFLAPLLPGPAAALILLRESYAIESQVDATFLP